MVTGTLSPMITGLDGFHGPIRIAATTRAWRPIDPTRAGEKLVLSSR
jgi:hypothetical protein